MLRSSRKPASRDARVLLLRRRQHLGRPLRVNDDAAGVANNQFDNGSASTRSTAT